MSAAWEYLFARLHHFRDYHLFRATYHRGQLFNVCTRCGFWRSHPIHAKWRHMTRRERADAARSER